jgi:hypothetical protein
MTHPKDKQPLTWASVCQFTKYFDFLLSLCLATACQAQLPYFSGEEIESQRVKEPDLVVKSADARGGAQEWNLGVLFTKVIWLLSTWKLLPISLVSLVPEDSLFQLYPHSPHSPEIPAIQVSSGPHQEKKMGFERSVDIFEISRSMYMYPWLEYQDRTKGEDRMDRNGARSRSQEPGA